MLVIEGIYVWHGSKSRTRRFPSLHGEFMRQKYSCCLCGSGVGSYTEAMEFNQRRGAFNVVNVLGFPTRIQPGFIAFLALLLIVYPFPLGFWVAGAIGIFTVIHELGHALAARRAGCSASISLDFMMAYAAYRSDRELTWKQKIGITIAGPLAQITSALIVLLAIGVNPFSRNDISDSYASASIWWAGLALGALNLVPILPLDGGAIIANIAEHFSPERGRNAVLQASFILTIAITAAILLVGEIGLVPLFIFMLIIQYQQLAQPRQMKSLLDRADLQASGDPDLDAMIINAMITDNQLDRAAVFTREAYIMCPAFIHAFSAARIAVKKEDFDTAAMWLTLASRAQINGNELRSALADTHEFDAMREHHDVLDEWFSKS